MTHASPAQARELVDLAEVTSIVRVTREDRLLFDVYTPDAARLEEVVERSRGSAQ
ncbi:hypothetical protein RWH45_15910 [Microbacterium sp. KSW4-17]|uniref:Uncharacterized protein n=1 Tax=Microbacterium galbum TaxID=3075994 RepID=A0ABU3TBD7_9MICO|nr:hypothetical protein [Microbacterium sp. KSW4-17]MDU0368695.1 hypothetical protein [Microbacterium sp. KSW4-17]